MALLGTLTLIDLVPSLPTTHNDSHSGGDTVWVLYGPCGCRYGWLSVFGRRGDPILDEEGAWATSAWGAVHQVRMRATGFRWVLEISEPKQFALDDCSHGGNYIGSVWVSLEGHRWVGHTESSSVEHLVPVSDVDMVEYYSFGYFSAAAAPLCSAETRTPWFSVVRADPCAACERVASATPKLEVPQ